MLEVEFISESKKDFEDAVEYYESKEKDLGKRLRDEVAEILHTAANAPFLWRERKEGYRRINFPIFPYYLAYTIRDNKLIILAIAASRRKPGYWHKRLETD